MLSSQIEASRYDPGRDGPIDHVCPRCQLVQVLLLAPWGPAHQAWVGPRSRAGDTLVLPMAPSSIAPGWTV
jgi:hypothetical protein